MNESAVRQLAQSDPTPNLTQNWGETVLATRKALAELTRRLRELDAIQEQLRDNHDIDIDVNLGPIGEAAKAARRDLEKERPTQFELPR